MKNLRNVLIFKDVQTLVGELNAQSVRFIFKKKLNMKGINTHTQMVGSKDTV